MFVNNQTFTLQNLPLIYQLDLLWFEWRVSRDFSLLLLLLLKNKLQSYAVKFNSNLQFPKKIMTEEKRKKVKTKAGKNHSMTFYKVRRESVTRDRGKICMYREISTPKWTSFSKILQIKPIAILERNPFRSCSFTFEEKSSNDVSRYQRGIRLICFTYLYIALLGWKLIFFYKKIRGESLQMWQNCTHLI